MVGSWRRSPRTVRKQTFPRFLTRIFPFLKRISPELKNKYCDVYVEEKTHYTTTKEINNTKNPKNTTRKKFQKKVYEKLF